MSSRTALLVPVLLTIFGLTSPAVLAGPNLISNPTFAGITVLEGGLPGTTAGGWTFINNAGSYFGSGAEGGFLNSGGLPGDFGSIEQAVSTVPGTLYHIDFFLTQSILGAINVAFGDTVGYSATNPTLPSVPDYAEFSFDATATTSSTLFSFNGSDLAGTTWIDNVSVVAAAPPSIAEPGSLALLVSSLLGLGAIHCRKHT